MFDFDNVLELMKKYGYSSTSVHPYIYQKGDSLGICYTYIDDEYGLLERIKIFDDIESFEYFLKQLDFLKTSGKNYNIRMVLDNYESMNPKVVFLRNEKIMVEGEMFDISNYDLRENQRSQLDRVTQVVYKAGDLLLVYDEVKGRQLQYLRNIVSLKNTLRTKYFELQKEIDKYNKYKVERALKLLPEVKDIGINDTMEVAIKDRYNMYIAQTPSYEEAVDFLKEVWDLNKNLELNSKYYEAQKEENDTRNEMRVVDEKLALMKKLNEDYKPFFGIDLVSKFRKINKKFNLINNSIADEVIQENIERVERKYAVYNQLDILATSDYLREAMQNTNYGDLVIKYSTFSAKNNVITNKLPLNEVAASLSIQYRDKFDLSLQAMMVLYNNHKYRKLCNALLEIDGFETLPIKKVVNKLNGIKGFSKIKTECYDIVKKRINDPINASIKMSLFSEFDFTSFESFVHSLIVGLVKLKSANDRMVINGNINMYLQVKKVNDIYNKKFVLVTNDLNTLLNETKENKEMVGIVLLKANTPVLYSPYYFDVGDIYNKDSSLQMYIKEMINFELLVDISDITINIDPVKTNVVRYYSEPVVNDNVSVVSDIMMSYKTTFCKYAFTNNLPISMPVVEENVSSAAVSTPNLEIQSEPVNTISNGNPALSIFDSSPVLESTPVLENSTLVDTNSVSGNQNEVVSQKSVQSNTNETVLKPELEVESSLEENKPVVETKKEVVGSVKDNQVVVPIVVESKENIAIPKETPLVEGANKKVLEDTKKVSVSKVIDEKKAVASKEKSAPLESAGNSINTNVVVNSVNTKDVVPNKTVVQKTVEVKPVENQTSKEVQPKPSQVVKQSVKDTAPSKKVTPVNDGKTNSSQESVQPVVSKPVQKTAQVVPSKPVPTTVSKPGQTPVSKPVQKSVQAVAQTPEATVKDSAENKVLVQSVGGTKAPVKAVVVKSVGAPIKKEIEGKVVSTEKKETPVNPTHLNGDTSKKEIN